MPAYAAASRAGSAKSARHTRGTSASAPTTIVMRHRTSGSAARLISLPRIAVKPQSTTQTWICSLAFATGVIVPVSNQRPRATLPGRAGSIGAPLFLGPFPALLEMLFPVLRPGAAEIVDVAFVEERELRRAAVRPVDDRALHTALDERVAVLRIVVRAYPIPRRDREQRPDEGFRIVERRLDEEAVAVVPRPDHLDDLERVAELEHRVRQRPALHVRGPCDERVAVPEPDRLAVPLRDLLDMLAADQHLAQEVVRDAGDELHLGRRHERLALADPALRPPAHQP